MASDSGVCVCPPTLQARVCNKATREKGVRPTPNPLHTCTTFLICHPHFFKLSFFMYSDNSKSFFYPNDFEISGLDCILKPFMAGAHTALRKVVCLKLCFKFLIILDNLLLKSKRINTSEKFILLLYEENLHIDRLATILYLDFIFRLVFKEVVITHDLCHDETSLKVSVDTTGSLRGLCAHLIK